MKKIEIPEGYEARIEGNKIILEPKESEDEKIRKKILAEYKERLIIESMAYKNPVCNKETVDYLEKAIAYLEKQKEPKPVEWEWPNLSNCIKNCKKCLAKCFYRKEAYEEKKPADWSEDEKIRKQLIDEVKEQINNIPVPDCCNSDDLKRLTILESWLAYLEKQKEQSITANDLDEEVHRFFDDCIVVHEAKLYGNISERVIPVDCYELTARHFAMWGEKQKEQKPAEWSEEDEAAYGDLIWCIEQAKKSAKDENDMGNIWFAEKWVKERIKYFSPQPKQEWSEGTKKALDKISDYLKYKGREEDADFIKHLSSQPHWKPSEEQMYILNWVANILLNHDSIVEEAAAKKLQSLYEDLKKM